MPSAASACATCCCASGLDLSAWSTVLFAFVPMSPNEAANHELAGTRESSVGSYGDESSFAPLFMSVVPRMRRPLSVAPSEKPKLRTFASASRDLLELRRAVDALAEGGRILLAAEGHELLQHGAGRVADDDVVAREARERVLERGHVGEAVARAREPVDRRLGGGARVRDQRGVLRERDHGVVVAAEEVVAAVRAERARVLVLHDRGLELRLVAHVGEAEHRGIGAARRHVEHADGDLRAEPAAQLRERRAVVGGVVRRLVELASRASASSGSAGRARAAASRPSSVSSMFASTNAAVEAGKAWAARPSVPAAPAAPALPEPPQPAATRPRGRGRSTAASSWRRPGRRRVVMSALYRRRIERPCREACAMPNIFEPEFDQQREHPGFRAQRARLGWQLATQRLGASIWEIEPGEAAYPYHYHLAEEELLVVLMGRPSVRTNGDWRELEPGEVLSFALGAERRPPARELGRGHRPLPRDLDQRHARPRRLPRLGQARRLRAPARPQRPLGDLPPGRRRRLPRRRAAADPAAGRRARRPSGTRCECHLDPSSCRRGRRA